MITDWGAVHIISIGIASVILLVVLLKGGKK